MTAGHSTDSIPPFPAELDREAFANWLTGFVDGEGCFGLSIQTSKRGDTNRTSYLRIGLRSDDIAVLRLAQSFWQCGSIVVNARHSNGIHPVALLRIQKIADVHGVILPHFERYPLLAKKRHDFTIWSEAVRLQFVAATRPVTWGRCGRLPKWTDEECRRYAELAAALKRQRLYAACPPASWSSSSCARDSRR